MDFAALLQRYYNMSNMVKIVRISLSSINHIYKVYTDGAIFILKHLFNYQDKTLDSYKYQISVSLFAYNRCLPVVVPVANNHGEYITVHNSEMFILYPYIRSLSSHRNINVYDAIDLLNTFHQEMKDFKCHFTPLTTCVEYDINEMIKYQKGEGEYAVLAQWIDGVIDIPSILTTLTNSQKCLIQSCLEFICNSFERFPREEIGLIHYDYGPHNLLVDERSRINIIDFEYAHFDSIAVDITKTAKYFSLCKTQLSLTRFWSIIDYYSQISRVVFEAKHIYISLLFVSLRNVIKTLTYCLTTQNANIAYLDLNLSIIDYLFENPKRFLSKRFSI